MPSLRLMLLAVGLNVALIVHASAQAELPPGWPESAITVDGDASAAALRVTLSEQIWGCAGPPTRKAATVHEDVGTASLGAPIPLPNVQRVDRYSISTFGQTLRPWLVRPRISNGALSLVVLGHDRDGVLTNVTASSYLVAEALTRGHHVLVVPMPMGGTRGHDALGTQAHEAFSPLQYFLDTPIITLNTFLAQNPAPSTINAMGVSGGAWTVTLLAALDTRVRESIQIAGTLPLALRSRDANEAGDWEQRLPGLSTARGPLDYLDLYLMGADNGRMQLQINNELDTCCFSGRKDRAYAAALTTRNPRWTFERVATAGRHGISDDDVRRLVGPRLGPPLVSRALAYNRIVDDGDPGFSKSGPDWRQWTARAEAYNRDDWSPGSDTCAHGGEGRHAAAWAFDGVPDTPVRVDVSYQAWHNRATNVTYEIRDGGERVIWSGLVNQRLAPAGGGSLSQVTFHHLATVQTATGRLLVSVTDNADGCVNVDAARISTH